MKNKNGWLKINNKSDVYEIFIKGDIEDDRWKGWSWGEDSSTYPGDIKTMLDEAKGKEVVVYVNSGGGDVFAGIAISNMLKRHDAKTKAIVEGLAASAASIIVCGCDEIEIPENAFLMIHKPWGGTYGTADDMRLYADVLDSVQSAIVTTYMEKTKDDVERETIDEMVNKETWLNGKEAAEFFNVNLTQSLEMVACTGNLVRNWKDRPHDIVVSEVLDLDERNAKKVGLNGSFNLATGEIEVNQKLLEIDLELNL